MDKPEIQEIHWREYSHQQGLCQCDQPGQPGQSDQSDQPGQPEEPEESDQPKKCEAPTYLPQIPLSLSREMPYFEYILFRILSLIAPLFTIANCSSVIVELNEIEDGSILLVNLSFSFEGSTVYALISRVDGMVFITYNDIHPGGYEAYAERQMEDLQIDCPDYSHIIYFVDINSHMMIMKVPGDLKDWNLSDDDY